MNHLQGKRGNGLYPLFFFVFVDTMSKCYYFRSRDKKIMILLMFRSNYSKKTQYLTTIAVQWKHLYYDCE